MLQQNQPIQIEINKIIDAPTNQYPKRQFIIEGLLATGRNSEVFIAKPVQWGVYQNNVALKIHYSYKVEVKQLYQKVIEHQNKFEIQNNQNDNQSNFIRIYDYFEYFEYLVSVMEIGQNDLKSYLKKYQNLAFQQKQLICKQILQSIIFFHSLNLIHKDISLDCYLMVGLSVKLINFGSAFEKDDFTAFNKDDVIVNHVFKPPETYNHEYTAAADVWSLACIFYEVMRGSSIFLGSKNFAELNRLKISQPYISEKIDELQITEEWKQTMKKMFFPQPNLRITPKEAMEQLSKKSSAFIIQKIQQPNFVAQQQYPIALQSQNFFRQINQEFQQTQVQSSIFLQINAMITTLDQPNTINQLLQQTEQSKKLLESLKDKIQQMQNQLENNTTSLQPKLSFDTTIQNQKYQQKKKEFPPAIQQSLDEIKKRCLDIEEQCISNSEEAELNQNLQKINEEFQILKNVTQNLDKIQKEYLKLCKQVDQLKEEQKVILKSKILDEELKQLYSENYKQLDVSTLKKEVEKNSKFIFNLEQSIYTINYLEVQKQNQQNKIDNLNQLISTQALLENEVKIQRDELLELKCKQKQQEFLNLEIQNNKKAIQQLKQQGQQLTDVQKQFEESQREIENHRSQLSQLRNLEFEIKNNKDQVKQMKSKINQLPALQNEADKLNKEIISLERDYKKLQETEEKIGNLVEQKQQLKEQNNQKSEEIKILEQKLNQF
ncbi:unnamed protein product (macronuclear) [Paramecium tetraurelia]|uniref:Cyclin-dependent kinase 2 homolog n=1 Tax=Paramecium tetraurelia TaxID=5888 RepID=A0D5R9_PARTE|nr:uncharacterized protein GSPATT00013816001 [Paramecium tetraurelia]CAK78386.1 unnamed protein product [Paramecium tetraurelia]|eukprot:XP_001445783.1 hypothetical protein (macronuclear) [Paramecium tetraurelia strain d4-2]